MNRLFSNLDKAKIKWFGAGALIVAVATFGLISCGQGPMQTAMPAGADAAAAVASYVAPGATDEYYLFYSGGHSGNVYVAGVPSMRHIATIPVFAQYPATGYGFDDDTKKMLGGFNWGDVHHPSASETKGDYDGRWMFVNDNSNNRIARIDLRDFKTKQILGPIPNISGLHGGAFVTPNTEYVLAASRFSVPLPKGTVAPIEEYATKYNGLVSGVAIDAKSGEMSVGWQILMPPFNFDLGDAGKGPSEGWAFWTCYNSERATGKLEVTSTQKDRDYIAAVNWKEAEKAVKEGKIKEIGGVKVIDPKATPGIVYLVPCSKSPHGVDVSPDGKWFIGSGKLQSITTAFSVDKMLKAIAAKDFAGGRSPAGASSLGSSLLAVVGTASGSADS